ncbi:MAG: hypothetical protein QM757_45105, partial [Paludibaculum sp.]
MARRSNFLNLAFLDADPDLPRVRSDEWYRIELNGRPCQMSSILARQVDVLVSGQTIATSGWSVLDGCLRPGELDAVQRATGETEYRNSATGKWETGVDESGGVVLKLEELQGVLRLYHVANFFNF